MSTDRSWMYQTQLDEKSMHPEFLIGVDYFVTEAFKHPECVMRRDNKELIRCPCRVCDNTKFLTGDEVRRHLYLKGFTLFYECWQYHGESIKDSNTMQVDEDEGEMNMINEMVLDAAGPDFNWELPQEAPNAIAKCFYEMLEVADKPLWELEHNGNNIAKSKESLLSIVSQLLNLKSDYQMPRECFNRMISIFKSALPEKNILPPNFHASKRLLGGLGLKYQKIDACPNDCMLYYKDNQLKDKCDICGESRYKSDVRKKKGKPVARKILRYLPITPRLQRLYMSSATAEQMRWHKEGDREKKEVMVHPADGKAWKSFDDTYPEFANETRNVRLGLATDGFTPFSLSAASYSCWPVFVVPYNLPPGMAMRSENTFLTLVIPGPKSPGRDIDIYLEPLLDELRMLWNDGVETFDCFRKQNFRMKAALLWTISDFPAYEMLSGWSTHGRLACPICMGKTKAFRLKKGKKATWFDHRAFLSKKHKFREDRKKFKKNTEVPDSDSRPRRLRGKNIHKSVMSLRPDTVFGKSTKNRQEIDGYGETHHWQKRSIFWRLPYWSSNLIRHNLDVMHIEANNFGNIFNTVMDTEKTKDNIKARLDMAEICDRPELELRQRANGSWVKPKAPFCLTKDQKKLLCQWLKELKFPDGYASNWSRIVNVEECKFQGLKSHDCHIFMERLLPIAFRDFLPDYIWEPLTELSNFFRELCATELKVSHLKELEDKIIVTLCKLEQIFPPGFFDSMQHLLVHLAYEGRVGGPVSFRWMYHFERELRRLRKKVGNKAHPEGSMVEAYIIEEISNFCSIYFKSNVRTRLNQNLRYDDGKEEVSEERASIFAYSGRPIGRRTSRRLEEKELQAAQLYVLLNCPEVQDYVDEYDETVKAANPGISGIELNRIRDKKFVSWFRKRVNKDRNIDRTIKDIGLGPYNEISCYGAYDVNGYRFHTETYGIDKMTINSGVCIKGGWYDGTEHDYYGILEDIVELEYRGLHNKVVLFKCRWFDVSGGVKVDKKHGLVEVNHTSVLSVHEPFVFAVDAIQVYYLRYPSLKRERKNWWVPYKVKSKVLPSFRLNDQSENEVPINADFFQEDDPCPFTVGVGDDISDVLNNEDEAEPLSAADVEYVQQQLVISEDDEMEMTLSSDDESENQNEYRDMGYEDGEGSLNHDDVTDSDSDFE